MTCYTNKISALLEHNGINPRFSVLPNSYLIGVYHFSGELPGTHKKEPIGRYNPLNKKLVLDDKTLEKEGINDFVVPREYRDYRVVLR